MGIDVTLTLIKTYNTSSHIVARPIQKIVTDIAKGLIEYCWDRVIPLDFSATLY